MRLGELAPGAAPEHAALEITDLAYDSRAVKPGTLFFCVPGFTRDGHEFAPDAVARGAVALVVERALELDIPQIRVASVRQAMAPAAAAFFGDPTRQLDVIGVTGTNGKTTTAYLVRELLRADGRQTGLLGTVTSWIGGREYGVQRTTPEAIDLQGSFRQMLDGGDVACAIEVSSHALELHRADAIDWAVAIFTNLTQDHLDFHPTMDDYFAAKRRLFTAGRPRTKVVNIDDPYGARLASALSDAVTIGIANAGATYRATAVRTDLTGSRFRVHGPDGALTLRTPLRGAFNVYNALGALAAARALDVPLQTIKRAIEDAGQVPGRFEPVDAGQPFAVLVDYSHTPDSLENALHAARELTHGSVTVVFGCGGDRDRGKRPLMGEIATRLADRAIVTSDNPRSEDPEQIIDEILKGCPHATEHETDRRTAIARALDGAEPGDVVLIAGKGHERGQELANGVKLPFDDVAVARELLQGARAAR